ncbi:hypothetical protein OF83DRAFT_1252624 [Amylostereum chailletii]|nr:hypothetical protein OF83DRAFT_1252624 [Amylostereum chailletii]
MDPPAAFKHHRRPSQNTHSQPPVSTSSSHNHDVSQAPPQPRYRNRLEEYMAQADLNYRPKTEAEFKEFFRSMGKPGKSYSHFVERHNKASNKMMARTNGVIPTIGHKPLTGQESQEDVQFFPIPNSHLYIRIWSGGMDRYGQYCLDYFDPATNTPGKAPEGHQIWPISRPGVFSFAGALQSWEASFECAEYSKTSGTVSWKVLGGGWCVQASRTLASPFQSEARRVLRLLSVSLSVSVLFATFCCILPFPCYVVRDEACVCYVFVGFICPVSKQRPLYTKRALLDFSV